MENNKVKVLYIAGAGRSGSTLLSHILAQIAGFFSVGEAVLMWEENLMSNRLCGCMTPFKECEVWRGIMNEAYGGIVDLQYAEEMHRLRSTFARTRSLPLLLMPRRESVLGSGFKKYVANLEKVYRATQSSTGCNLIVDASKFPAYGYILGTIPTIELYVVHLVREPQAVAYSALRKKWNPDRGEYLRLYSPAQGSWIWDYTNLATEAVLGRSRDRYLLLRYEDLVMNPREAIERVLKLVREEGSQLPLVAENKVALTASHMLSGNPGVYKRTGIVEIQPDEEWKAKMKPWDKKLVSFLTAPLRLRYGYRNNGRRR